MSLSSQMHINIVNICCLLLVISSCSADVEQVNSKVFNETKLSNVTTGVNDKNGTAIIPQTIPTKVSVPTEGGGFVSDEHDQTHTSREGKVDTSPSVNDVNPLESNSTILITNSSTIATVSAINQPPTVLQPESTNSTNSTVKDNGSDLADTDLKPVYEVPPKVDGKNSVPKKEPKSDSEEQLPTQSSTIIATPTLKNDNNATKQGNATLKIDNNTNKVNTTLITVTNTTAATPAVKESATPVIKEKPKKPLFTEATDDSFAPSNFVSGGKNESSKKKLTNSVPSLENVEKRKSKSADYVVPIVGIILSVPLVTIIISVLYKRTAEWWHHRHYRRMDFLIEGMYNN